MIFVGRKSGINPNRQHTSLGGATNVCCLPSVQQLMSAYRKTPCLAKHCKVTERRTHQQLYSRVWKRDKSSQHLCIQQSVGYVIHGAISSSPALYFPRGIDWRQTGAQPIRPRSISHLNHKHRLRN